MECVNGRCGCILLIIDVYMSRVQVADASRLVGDVGATQSVI
jgi:hypothetical protein